MCLVTTLRLAFKQALNSGRVYKQRLNVCDPSPTPAGDVRVDFEQYARLLSDCEWTTFQRHERAYRGTLDTKLLQVRSNFAVTHGGAKKWGRLVTILTSAFFNNGIFSATQRNSRTYGFQLLKYVARILKKFPLSADFPRHNGSKGNGGNRWYKAKNDKPPSFLVMGQPIKVTGLTSLASGGSRSRSSLQSFSIVSIHLNDLSPSPSS
ncbi:hypothetical protein F7725_012015 [Dissostichus mawsoni]|uniref:Uncharacterized protein n=1 Tax=Dissostichus mawsoni TaxID=36200 RepID=A0A7J5ZAF8_DISMA|nr:hypothetical protein F7725_012015 [Dissostichus mawsoni]